MLPLPLAQVPEVITATAAAANDTGIDVNALAKNANGNPVMLLALAAVGLLGGKKVWEIVQKRQEAQHDEKMAQIEAGKNMHAECQAKQSALQDQVATMTRTVQAIEDGSKAGAQRAADVVAKAESRVAELESKVADVQRQIAAAEAKARKAAKASKAKADGKPT